MDLKNKVRIIEDFPKEGISFKDVTPILQDKDALKECIKQLSDYLRDKNIDLVVGPEARGFLFGVPVALEIGAGFIPVRKPGKLPYDTIGIEYDLEYGSNILEIHKDAVKKGQRVAIVDDLLATGGTVEAAVKLLEDAGAEVVSLAFVIELTDLKGRDKLEGHDVMSLMQYNI